MTCVKPGDPDYEEDRRIANARFDYFPGQICYCKDAGEVQRALNTARDQKIPVRIRSGGHHHEGMCSGDGVLMIDVSEINHINLSSDLTTATIGVGAKLGDIYRVLLAKNRILPGGGCGDVHIGGLAQGGGWGLYARALGLTCDNILGIRSVLADGRVVNAPGEHPAGWAELLWAVRGGGGGNFGVITEFDIQLTEVPALIWQFTLTWNDSDMRHRVMEEWRANFPNDSDRRLTSFCRVSSVGSEDPPVICAGNFLGDADSLVMLLVRLLPNTFASCTSDFSPVHVPDAPWTSRVFHHPHYQPGPPQPATATATATSDQPPTQTCDGGYYPHKVSSCYPTSTYSAQASLTITRYLDSQPPESKARRYLSLHCLGGAVTDPSASQGSCFAFRNKPFMLQYQTWWSDAQDRVVEANCLQWIRSFRLTMKQGGFTEGSFINFPDRELPIESYYGAANFSKLRHVKRDFDPTNLLAFPMGIPSQ